MSGALRKPPRPSNWRDIARELYNSVKTLAADVSYGHSDEHGQEIGRERLRRAKQALARYEYHCHLKPRKRAERSSQEVKP